MADVPARIQNAIMGVLSRIPTTKEPYGTSPVTRARAIAKAAALKTATVSGSLSLPRLFRHAAAHTVRGMVVRAGERILIEKAPAHAVAIAMKKIGVPIAKRVAGRGPQRWTLPDRDQGADDDSRREPAAARSARDCTATRKAGGN